MDNALYADTYAAALLKEQQPRFRFQAKTPAELNAWQTAFRQELETLLGIPRIRARATDDLAPVCYGQVTLEDHIRETWTIQSEPGYAVPFFLLRPLEQSGPLPLVLTPHGHGKDGKDTYAGIYHDENGRASIAEGERDVALQAVRAGYVAIAMDQRGFTVTKFKQDIADDKNNSCQRMQMHAFLFGRTLIGERCYDISRLIDFAALRPEIDVSRIAITGNSGGGTTSLFAAAVETRIGVAVPGSYFCTFADSIAAVPHCACNYVPGILTLGEMYDVAGLIAPRPFMAVAGREDPIFPLKGVRKAFDKLKQVYTVADVPERCQLSLGDGGHRYYKADVWPFMDRYLKGMSDRA